MSKKDYELLAVAIRTGLSEGEKRGYKMEVMQEIILIDYIGDALLKDNPKFNKQRFMLACGIDYTI